MLCSYWSFVFAFAHAGLHMRLPKGNAPWEVWVPRVVFVALACYGAYAFVQLGLLPYLMGQVQFAFADYNTPLALSIARYIGVAALVSAIFYFIKSRIKAA